MLRANFYLTFSVHLMCHDFYLKITPPALLKVSPNDLEFDAQGSWRWKHPSILERTCDFTDTSTATLSSMSPGKFSAQCSLASSLH
jgi:hypothetical protein